MAFNIAYLPNLISMYQSGNTVDEISKKIGIGRDTLYRRLHSSGTKLRRSGSRIGCIPWNKGGHYPDSLKIKMNFSGLSLGRGWNRGKKDIYSQKTIHKMQISHSDKNAECASNWKGGLSRAYKTGFYSPEYKRWRKSVFERDNYQCRKCGIKSGVGHAVYLTAHHIKSFAKYPPLRYEIDNGITLCESCHCQEDKYRARFMKMEDCRV
jgi:hypothetical protein